MQAWERVGEIEWRYGALELWECAAGVGTWMCRDMEIRSSGGMLQARGRGGGEPWRSRGALQA